MTSEPSQRTSAALRLATFGLFALAACAGAIGKAPPPTDPAYTQIVVIQGTPIVNAAKAARLLQDAGFATKRFSADSLWASRAADKMSGRLRYTMPSRDSTRILVELWGTCERGGRGCFLGEVIRLVKGLTTEEPTPQ